MKKAIDIFKAEFGNSKIQTNLASWTQKEKQAVGAIDKSERNLFDAEKEMKTAIASYGKLVKLADDEKADAAEYFEQTYEELVDAYINLKKAIDKLHVVTGQIKLT